VIRRVPKRAVGVILAVIATMLVLANQHEVGLARDEIVYMQNGMRYADWWIGLASFQHGVSKEGVTRTFGGPNATDNNREHPPLMKTLTGLSHRVLHEKLGVDEVTAFRFPSAVMQGVLVLLVFSMVFSIWGFLEAVIAALLVMFLPRAMFHASLACFDAPIMTLWFATVYAYWRCLDGRKWPWQVGVAFGLALATKHNALLLPFALGVHYNVAGIRAARVSKRPLDVIAHRWRLIVSLAVVGPLVLYVLWPWLWFDPITNVKAWLTFHLKHVHYNFEYLGMNWNAPRFPWHVALVTTLFTLPVVTLAGSAIGTGVMIAQRKHDDRARAPGLLLVLSAAASMGPFFLGSTPIFGAEKHWMPALPSLCIAGGVGIAWCARALPKRLAPVLVSLVILAAAVETLQAQPYALTWYNALAGGAPGGADKGMNRQFWGVAARGALPILATQPPGKVYSHDASPAWGFYQKLGLLPRGFNDAGYEEGGIANSKYAIVIHEKHFNRHDYLIWKSYGTVQPLYVLRSDGVPIVSIYRRP
jgi:hypothetical protein